MKTIDSNRIVRAFLRLNNTGKTDWIDANLDNFTKNIRAIELYLKTNKIPIYNREELFEKLFYSFIWEDNNIHFQSINNMYNLFKRK